LKSKNPDIKIIVADPDRSLFSGGDGRPYLVEGVGEDFYPAAWDPTLYDEILPISDMESFTTARRVSQEEGILIGGSGGLAIAGALKVAKHCKEGDVVVVLNPDSGRGYLSRVYNDEWMAKNGFIESRGTTVRDVVKTGSELIYVSETDTIGKAIETMRKHGISQLPVCQGSAPFAPAEVLGSIHEATLLLSKDRGGEGWTESLVKTVMRPRMPLIGIGESVSVAAERLENSNALLVLEGGRTCGILSRSDLLSWYETKGETK
jgi:cystathionine beta-synthase